MDSWVNGIVPGLDMATVSDWNYYGVPDVVEMSWVGRNKMALLEQKICVDRSGAFWRWGDFWHRILKGLKITFPLPTLNRWLNKCDVCICVCLCIHLICLSVHHVAS